MKYTPQKYGWLLLAHILIGILIYEIPVAAKIYAFLILFTGIYFTVKNRNAHHEVLYASAYIVGAEVFLRMTHGNPDYEFAKFSVMGFSLLGIYYSGFLKKSWPYWIFLLLLVPGVLIGLYSLESPVRPKIIFDISGPVCLAICSVYTFRRKISVPEISNILLAIGFPIISCGTYLFLHSPEMKTIHFNTESSFALSGGFGPNQVATTLGLGMIVFFSRLVLKPSRPFEFVLNLMIATYFCYRGFLTFSRGGIVVAFATISVLLIFVYLNSESLFRKRLRFKALLVFISFSAVFLLTSYQSNGLIEKRYSNEDKHGNYKIHKVNGRVNIAKGEIQIFKENPVFGIGAGGGKEIRIRTLGKKTSTHNEMTRMLAEHGLFGIGALLILLSVPLLIYFNQEQNIYLAAFFVFWILTISHSGMRTAAPSFLYALTLLCIRPEEKPVRENG